MASFLYFVRYEYRQVTAYRTHRTNITSRIQVTRHIVATLPKEVTRCTRTTFFLEGDVGIISCSPGIGR